MNTLKIDEGTPLQLALSIGDKLELLRGEYDECKPGSTYTVAPNGNIERDGGGGEYWGSIHSKDDDPDMIFRVISRAAKEPDARQVRNETAEADRPLEPQTEGTHIHAALLAQESTGLFVTGLNAEEMEELRVPGKRKPMDSAGDLIRNYPDLASDLAADDEFTAAFLNALADRVHATNVAAGWWTYLESGQSSLHTRNVGEMLMLVVSEISEALEAVRKNLMDDKLPHRPGLTVELADAVIRILDLAGSRMAIERDAREQYDASWMPREGFEAQYGAEPCYEREPEPEVHPFGTVLIEKMAYNRTRSDHQIANRLMHGGKKI